ncbi:MAG: AMP-binding protein, partial [Lysobacterales bacterium]
AMFGIVRGGMVVVPLNVSVSDAAVAGMIANSGARAVIASDAHVLRVEKLRPELSGDVSGRLIGLGDVPDGWTEYASLRAAGAPELAEVQVDPQDECNIIYSSGTTGQPKGIVHSHACRMAWATEMTASLRYHYGARTLCSLGLYSNITWVAMLATVYAGGTVVIQRRFEPRSCLQAIEHYRITHSAMVPLQYQRLLECEAFDQFDLSSLDALMCCGSPLSVEMKRQIMERVPGQFVELYGLTEGLVTILSPEDMADKTASVGRPCPGQRLVIVGNDGCVLPACEKGEIVGYSSFMMSGYHENDAENEAATWIAPSGERWLRTGDIGMVDEEGFLYLVDRKKDMIISGGQNIYPADIEAVLIQHEHVSEVAVVGVNSRKWGETPFAVIVPVPGRGERVENIVAWANGRLGKQQRIAAGTLVEALPRNPNGKVLKRELRKQYASLTL